MGLGGLFSNVQLMYRLYQDERVPSLLKMVVPLVVALYFIMPFDLIPDFIPGLGQLDDLGVVLLALNLFVNLAPRTVVDEHRRALGLSGAASDAPDRPTTRLHETDRPAGAPRSADEVVDAFYKVINRQQK
jgi:uncharacterized membrane protein YkvA (DUF1232 family)